MKLLIITLLTISCANLELNQGKYTLSNAESIAIGNNQQDVEDLIGSPQKVIKLSKHVQDSNFIGWYYLQYAQYKSV